ncbi:phage related protein (plasmid) [Clostridium botulinum C str. Stockholm]|nr:phage related protein [Clostridium botulinum C str. Stockholm]
MVKARAGDITLPKITHMVFGDGGANKEGKPIPLLGEETKLKNQILKKTIDVHTYPNNTTCRYSCKLCKEDLADKNINEIGLVDSEGDLVAIKTFGNKYKDADMEMIFQIDDEF